jgi:hypothetical protein
MKSLFTFILFTAFASNSFAAEVAIKSGTILNHTIFQTTDNPTNFDRVLENFNQGVEPTFAEATGWWTGRCYSPSSPNTPSGSMLAVETRTETVGENHGPLFPPITKVTDNLAFIVHGNPTPAEFFDNISDSVRAEVASLLASEAFRSIVAYSANNSLSADNTAGNLHFAVKKNGDFLYGLSTIIADSDSSKKDAIYEVCYFFRKIN